MKNINSKLKNLLIILVVLFLCFLCSFVIVWPLWKFSTSLPKVYTAVVLILFFILVIFFIVRKIQKNKKLKSKKTLKNEWLNSDNIKRWKNQSPQSYCFYLFFWFRLWCLRQSHLLFSARLNSRLNEWLKSQN